MLGAALNDFATAEAAPASIRPWLDRLASLAVVPRETLDDLGQKLDSQRFDLVVVGQFKRGKTSLVNALVGAELLPVAVVPLTSVVTVLSWGTRPAASILLESGEKREIPLDDLAHYVTERGNPDNRKRVREAHIAYPSPWLQNGVRLIDTPGVGSVYQRNTDVAHRFLPKADAVLFLLSVDQPISRGECDFVASVREHAEKILFVLNKIDLLSDAERLESIQFTRSTLAEAMGCPPKVFPLSARLALAESRQGHSEGSAATGMRELSRALRGLLADEKSALLVAAVARQARRAISQARFSMELERSSLTTPLAELDGKLELFRAQKEKILRAGEDFDILLGADAGRALQPALEEDLRIFASALKSRVASELERAGAQRRNLSSRRLCSMLEDIAVAAIRDAFDGWRANQTAAVDRSFAALGERHAEKIDALLDELFLCAADLFAIPFVPRSAGGFRQIESRFHYKFWSEPPALRLISSSLVSALPRSIGTRLVLDRVRRFASESIDAQTGRLRYDFSQRLEKALTGLKSEMSARIAAAVDGIGGAVENARGLKTAGEADSAARLEALGEALRALEEIDAGIERAAAGEPRSDERSRGGSNSAAKAVAAPGARR